MFESIGSDPNDKKKPRKVPGDLLSKCINITTAKDLFKFTIVDTIPNTLFRGLTKLTSVEAAFDSTGVTSIPSDLFSDNPLLSDISFCFNCCRNLTTIPPDLFSSPNSIQKAVCVFSETGVKSIPKGLFDDCPKLEDIRGAFMSCNDLTKVPIDLLSKCKDI